MEYRAGDAQIPAGGEPTATITPNSPQTGAPPGAAALGAQIHAGAATGAPPGDITAPVVVQDLLVLLQGAFRTIRLSRVALHALSKLLGHEKLFERTKKINKPSNDELVRVMHELYLPLKSELESITHKVAEPTTKSKAHAVRDALLSGAFFVSMTYAHADFIINNLLWNKMIDLNTFLNIHTHHSASIQAIMFLAGLLQSLRRSLSTMYRGPKEAKKIVDRVANVIALILRRSPNKVSYRKMQKLCESMQQANSCASVPNYCVYEPSKELKKQCRPSFLERLAYKPNDPRQKARRIKTTSQD